MRLARHLLVALAGAAVLGPASFAALPPTAQRLVEFRAVLNHPAIAEVFRGDEIARIEYVRQNLYRVSGARCVLDLQTVFQPPPPGLVGPAIFEMREAARRCD